MEKRAQSHPDGSHAPTVYCHWLRAHANIFMNLHYKTRLKQAGRNQQPSRGVWESPGKGKEQKRRAAELSQHVGWSWNKRILQFMPKILTSAPAFLSLTFIGDFSCCWTVSWEATWVRVWVAVGFLTSCSLQGFIWERALLLDEMVPSVVRSYLRTTLGSSPRDSLLLNTVQPFFFLSRLPSQCWQVPKGSSARSASAEDPSCRHVFCLGEVWPQSIVF